MTTYDTRTTSTYEIEADIVEGAIAPGVSSREILQSAGSVEAAVQQVVAWYKSPDGRDAEFINYDSTPLDIARYARQYFERLAEEIAEEDAE